MAVPISEPILLAMVTVYAVSLVAALGFAWRGSRVGCLAGWGVGAALAIGGLAYGATADVGPHGSRDYGFAWLLVVICWMMLIVSAVTALLGTMILLTAGRRPQLPRIGDLEESETQ